LINLLTYLFIYLL